MTVVGVGFTMVFGTGLTTALGRPIPVVGWPMTVVGCPMPVVGWPMPGVRWPTTAVGCVSCPSVKLVLIFRPSWPDKSSLMFVDRFLLKFAPTWALATTAPIDKMTTEPKSFFMVNPLSIRARTQLGYRPQNGAAKGIPVAKAA